MVLQRDVGVVDNFISVYTFDALVAFSIGTLAYALAQSAKFIRVQFIPFVLILGMFPQLPVFEELSRFFIEHGHGPVKDKMAQVIFS